MRLNNLTKSCQNASCPEHLAAQCRQEQQAAHSLTEAVLQGIQHGDVALLAHWIGKEKATWARLKGERGKALWEASNSTQPNVTQIWNSICGKFFEPIEADIEYHKTAPWICRRALSYWVTSTWDANHGAINKAITQFYDDRANLFEAINAAHSYRRLNSSHSRTEPDTRRVLRCRLLQPFRWYNRRRPTSLGGERTSKRRKSERDKSRWEIATHRRAIRLRLIRALERVCLFVCWAQQFRLLCANTYRSW